MITQAKLKELLTYHPDTGLFYWKRPGKGRQFGKPISNISPHGYLRIKLEYQNYQAHRLAWCWVYGVFPTELDHKDGNKLNNKIENLRIATRNQNAANRGVMANNTSGHRGVCWITRTLRWEANIKFENTRLSKQFTNIDDAVTWYKARAAELFGEFARPSDQAENDLPVSCPDA